MWYAHFRFRQEKPGKNKGQSGNASKHPSNAEVNIGNHIWDDKVGDKRPDHIPSRPKGLRLLPDGRVWKLRAEEIGDGGPAHLGRNNN